MSEFFKRPDPLTAFELLYSLAAADGREAALFGDSIDLAQPAAASRNRISANGR